jgi:hypothetical protein
MTFTPEQISTLNEILDSKLSALANQIAESHNKGMSGLAKRLVADEIPKAIDSRFSAFEDKITPYFDEGNQRSLISSEMDSLLERLALAESSDDEDKKTKPAIVEEDIRSNPLYKQLEQRVEASERMAAEERKSRETIAEQQRVTAMKADVVKTLQGKVRPGTENELLTLLETSGLLVEDKVNNRYLVKGKDRFDIESSLPPEEVLPQIIASKFPHYQEARPGTGTSATPSGANSVPPQGRYYDGGNRLPTEQELNEAAKDPAKFQTLLKEAEAALR